MNASLEQFLEAQKNVYQDALKEIRNGEKRTHWMWFIFPQIRGLGKSEMAKFYGISDLSEEREYLIHPVLGMRLKTFCQALLEIQHSFPARIFGQIDAMKLKSSMTLFSIASQNQDNIFQKVLYKFFAGENDERTMEILKQ